METSHKELLGSNDDGDDTFTYTIMDGEGRRRPGDVMIGSDILMP